LTQSTGHDLWAGFLFLMYAIAFIKTRNFLCTLKQKPCSNIRVMRTKLPQFHSKEFWKKKEHPKLHFSGFKKTKHHYRNVLLNGFNSNGHALGFCSHTEKFSTLLCYSMTQTLPLLMKVFQAIPVIRAFSIYLELKLKCKIDNV